MTAFVIQGDAMHLPLPDECVDLVVTSPPYFGLRSYTDDGRPVPGQVGDEATPGEFIDALIAATTEMVRVLKPGGSIFINLGDKYQNQGGRNGHTSLPGVGRFAGSQPVRRYGTTVRQKSLLLLPERYRIAAVDRLGLIARAVIVWDKPNGLPESVTDRVRRSHEDWVHLTKQPHYFSAIDEIREPQQTVTTETGSVRYRMPGESSVQRQRTVTGAYSRMNRVSNTGCDSPAGNPLGKLPGSVWRIPTAPLSLPAELGVNHFAAFPPEWPKRIIQGWSPTGICVECGEGLRPVVRQMSEAYAAARARVKSTTVRDIALYSAGRSNSAASSDINNGVVRPDVRITGYACACSAATAPARPGVVLDPFGGTGTTAMVAHALGRVGISVDLSHDYCRVAQWRTHDLAQIAKVRDEVFRKPAPQPEAQDSLFTFAAVTP